LFLNRSIVPVSTSILAFLFDFFAARSNLLVSKNEEFDVIIGIIPDLPSFIIIIVPTLSDSSSFTALLPTQKPKNGDSVQ
jgi:hypothetical protein